MNHQSRLVRQIRLATARCPPREIPHRVCEVMAHALPADAVTLSLLTDTPSRQLLCASNDMATALEEVQFTVAEGPCITAAATGEAVHLTEVAAETQRWPLFVAALREKRPDIGAVHAFPLLLGGYVLGSMDLACRDTAGMPGRAIDEAGGAVEAISEALIPAQRLLLEEDEYPPWEPIDVIRAHWSSTHRAVGVVAARHVTSMEDALALMRARAFATGRTLAEITADILGPEM